jgi:hypothetical protein
MDWRLSTGGGYVVEKDGCLVSSRQIVERVAELERERNEARRAAEEWRDRWYNSSSKLKQGFATLQCPPLPWEKGD